MPGGPARYCNLSDRVHPEFQLNQQVPDQSRPEHQPVVPIVQDFPDTLPYENTDVIQNTEAAVENAINLLQHNEEDDLPTIDATTLDKYLTTEGTTSQDCNTNCLGFFCDSSTDAATLDYLLRWSGGGDSSTSTPIENNSTRRPTFTASSISPRPMTQTSNSPGDRTLGLLREMQTSKIIRQPDPIMPSSENLKTKLIESAQIKNKVARQSSDDKIRKRNNTNMLGGSMSRDSIRKAIDEV